MMKSLKAEGSDSKAWDPIMTSPAGGDRTRTGHSRMVVSLPSRVAPKALVGAFRNRCGTSNRRSWPPLTSLWPGHICPKS